MIHSQINEFSDSGNTSTEDLVVLNGLTVSLDATEVGRALRIPRHQSFLDMSSGEELFERLHRTVNYEISAIDETFEFLLETISGEGDEGNSFLSMDASSQLWRITVNVSTIEEINSSNNFSFSEGMRSPKTPWQKSSLFNDSLQKAVYLEQPFTLVTVGRTQLYLHHMGLDQEDQISFPSKRRLCSACVLPDGQIIAVGCTGTAHRYQTTTGWEDIGKLTFPRVNHAIVFHKGTVYVVGGRTGDQVVNSVERLSNTDRWEETLGLNNARERPAAVSMEGKLFVAGGLRDLLGFAGIEVLENGKWRVLNVNVPDGLHAHAFIFTPGHELVLLGGLVGDLPVSTMAIITEDSGVISEERSECEDAFPLNSWSYMEDENKVLVWGQKALWIFDISERRARAHKQWHCESSS